MSQIMHKPTADLERIDMPVEPAATAGMLKSISTAVATKGFEFLLNRAFTRLSQPTKSAEDAVPPGRFRDHFAQTFERCTRIKTLLSRDQPVDLLHQYVGMEFTTRGKGEIYIHDDISVIEAIRKTRRAVISGTAGGGKTMFMRYLWISFFAGESDQIPVFLELRRLNYLTSINLLSFVSHSIIAPDEKGTDGRFQDAIAKGRFAFIFDGFDEVAADKRAKVEKEILKLCQRNPNNVIVVSTRPDSRFDAWQEFTTYRVNPLNLKQLRSLIERVDFDPVVKRKFLDKLSKGLYEQHKSFLSSPLLATMMLLTFQSYAEIPEKIHVFYDLAYATLFSQHDALKESFNRDKFTKLPIDVFKRQLSCLCTVTYVEEKFEFTRSELLEFIRQSMKIDAVDMDAEAFLKDLLECVCILQEDGLTITFTHRSFQEFFTATFLSSLAPGKLGILLGRLVRRDSDSIFTMLLDMNRDLVEEAYVLPMIKRSRSLTKGLRTSPSAKEICECYKVQVTIYIDPVNQHTYSAQRVKDDNDIFQFRLTCNRMYRWAPDDDSAGKYVEADLNTYADFPNGLARFKSKQAALNIFDGRSSTGAKLTAEETQTAIAWFERSGHGAWLRDTERRFQETLTEIPKRGRSRSRDMKALLGI